MKSCLTEWKLLCLMGSFINPSYSSSFAPQLKHFLLPLLYVLLISEESETALLLAEITL